MAWFDPRAYGRAASTRAGKMLVLGASIATVVGLSVLVTGGFAQSSDESSGVVAQAKKRGFVPVCVQRSGHNQSQGDLNIRLRSQCAKGQRPLTLATWPVKRRRGTAGPQGPAGTGRTARTGRERRDPPDRSRDRSRTTAGPPIATEVGIASVFVARVQQTMIRRAGQPIRFRSWRLGRQQVDSSASRARPAQAPCKVSLGAAVISSETGTTGFYPRLLIHRHDGGEPMVYCEYADGADDKLGRSSGTACPDTGGRPCRDLAARGHYPHGNRRIARL